MSIMNILLIAIGILIIAIMVLALIYLKMYLNDKDPKPVKSKEEIANQAKNKGEKGATLYNKQSIFKFMEFDKVEDNMIIQKNGNRYLMAIECQGVNYDLMSQMEKGAVEDGFAQFLNTLRHPIQIYTQTRTINLESSIQTYKQRVDEIREDLDKKENQYKQMIQSGQYTEKQISNQNLEILKEKNLYEYGKDIIFNTERMSLNKNVLRKNYYIIIPYYASEAGDELFDKEEIRNIAFSELYTKAQSIIRTLSGCDILSKVMNSDEIADLLYNAYNRDEAETYGINKAIQAKFDELYITAPDVLDKKMEALNAEIDRKGLEQAKRFIDEVKSEKQKQYERKEKTLDELIDDMTEIIINENEDYIGKEVASGVKEKLKKKKEVKEKGGKVDVSKEKTRTR